MADYLDNIPDPHTWQHGRRGGILRAERAQVLTRWQIVQLIKFVILEYLNGNDDPEAIADQWLRERSEKAG